MEDSCEKFHIILKLKETKGGKAKGKMDGKKKEEGKDTQSREGRTEGRMRSKMLHGQL